MLSGSLLAISIHDQYPQPFKEVYLSSMLPLHLIYSKTMIQCDSNISLFIKIKMSTLKRAHVAAIYNTYVTESQTVRDYWIISMQLCWSIKPINLQITHVQMIIDYDAKDVSVCIIRKTCWSVHIIVCNCYDISSIVSMTFVWTQASL